MPNLELGGPVERSYLSSVNVPETTAAEESISERRVEKPTALWRLPTVKAMTGLCRSSIYQLISEQKFPAQIRYCGCVAWVSSQVEEWIDQQIKDSRKAG